MAFLHSVIGDNTPENREHLEKLGYTPLRFYLNGKYLYARSCTWANKNCTWQEPYFATDNNIDNSPKNINCIGNPQLFKAVSAMSDDSDELQYFTDGASWLKIPIGYDLASFLYTDWDGDCGLDNINKWHKATLSELQAHFQRV